jgi:uncharacterized protein YozE (UPF0346 family)
LGGSLKSEPRRKSGDARFGNEAKRQKQPNRSADFDFELTMSKFRELMAAYTVLLGVIEELRKYTSDEGRRFVI